MTAISLGSASLGIFVAGVIVQGITLHAVGFVVAVLLFTTCQAIATPMTNRVIAKYSPGLISFVGLISTGLSLWIASALPSGGIAIASPWVRNWLAGTVIVWLVTSLARWLLPKFVIARGSDE